MIAGADYPDINIGSEPTTDRFIVVMKGPEKKVVQGHALVNHKGMAFRTLHKVDTFEYGRKALDKKSKTKHVNFSSETPSLASCKQA